MLYRLTGGPNMPWDQDKGDSSFWNLSLRSADARGEDVSLVDVVQEFYPDLEEEEIIAYYDIHTDLSVVDSDGDAEEQISGDPNKDAVLLQDANNMEIWIAFAELIDNILDNHKEKHELLTATRGNCNLDVEIKCLDIQEENVPLTYGNGRIVIKENSGGIKPDAKSKSFLTTPGLSQWSAGAVGLWGRGGKLALAALGRCNTFSSHYPEGEHYVPPAGQIIINPCRLEFGSNHPPDPANLQDNPEHKSKSKNYYHKDNTYWKVPSRRVRGGYVFNNTGTSLITIDSLTERAINELSNPETVNEMLLQLAKVFRLKISENKRLLNCEININLTFVSLNIVSELGNHEIPDANKYEWNAEEMAKLFTHVPGFEPIRRKFIMPVSADSTLNMDIIVGHTLNVSPSLGWYMWGHDRLFEESYTNFSSTPGGGNVAYKPGHGQTGRILGFVRFSSDNDNSLIPWNGPDKWKFLEAHPLKEKIKKILGRCAQHYCNIGQHTFGDKNEPFLSLFTIDEGE
jgi:hypothetical protein